MKEANESIESTLRQESDFFDSSYILKATDDHSSLFEFCNEVINKQYSLREKAQEAEGNVVSKYNIDDEERKRTKAMVKKSVNSSNSIELSDFLSKPFSNFGGYDEAKRVFGEKRLKAVLESYNKNFVSLSS